MSKQDDAQLPAFHWYSFAFIGTTETGATMHASTYSGWPTQLITKPRIEEAKRCAGAKPEAVLLSCCYLGHMTRAEMIGE